MSDIKIFGKFVNVTDNILVDADQTYDSTQKKSQATINAEVLDRLNKIGEGGGSSSGPDLNPTTLTNEDLDTILGLGFYNAAGSNSVINKPAGVDAFGLHIYKVASGYTSQELTSGNINPGTIYYRQHNGSEWSGWQVRASIFSTTPVTDQVLTSDEFGRLKSSGFTIKTSVPADAKFTDTTYNPATPDKDGLLSKEDKKKLDAGFSANKVQTITQAEYDALPTKEPDRIYYIKG